MPQWWFPQLFNSACLECWQLWGQEDLEDSGTSCLLQRVKREERVLSCVWLHCKLCTKES